MRTGVELLREIIETKANELDADFNQYQAGAKNALVEVLEVINELFFIEIENEK
tara:strand:- start:2044 stop:2205 length:162 start_codon:yes stop_codon:yes gene_type:complete